MKQQEIDQMTLLQRAAAPTPKFFRYLQIIGLTLMAACGGVISGEIAQPQTGEILVDAIETLPPAVNSIAKYVGLAGALITAISQFTVASRSENTNTKPSNTRGRK